MYLLLHCLKTVWINNSINAEMDIYKYAPFVFQLSDKTSFAFFFCLFGGGRVYDMAVI